MFIVPLSQLPSIFPKEEPEVQKQYASGGMPFSDMLRDAMQNMQETTAIANQDNIDLAMGKMDDLHTMGINAQKAAIATDFAQQLASRAISAYNEIIRMQV